MGPIKAEITIDAPRERVFAIVSDLAMRPSFCDHFQEQYRLQRVDPTGVGAAARFQLAAARFPIWMETVITELEPPHLVLERGRGSRLDRMPTGTAWELVSNGGTMTDLTVSFWTEPSHPLDKLKDGLLGSRWHRRQWQRALKRLRELAESEAAIEPLQVAGASRP